MGKRILSKRRVEIAKSYLDSSGVTQVSVAEQHDVHRGTVQRIAKEQRGIRQALKQVKIERRLFATLAGAIDEIEGEVNDKLAREEQGDDAGFCWYMGYERWKKEENGQREEDPDPHFNAVKPVSDVAATALLKRGRKSEFRSQARSVRDRNPPGKLQDDALSAITGDRPIPDYHFLLSAYQLIYSFRGKISFIEGIVNAAQGQRGFSNWLFWIKYLEEEDELGLPKVNLYDENRNLLFKDRPQSTFRPDGGDKAFAEWMKAEEERDQSEWVACLPIFDGPERSEKTLRGYLNWECKDDERDDLQKALKTLQEERELISSRINRAYWEGVRNYILDSYPAEKESDSRESQIEIEDTLQHWICELRVFFGWEKESSRSSAADPYYVEKDKDVAELPLSPLIEHFARVTVSSESILSANDAKKLRSKPEYNGQSLFLEQQGGGVLVS